MNPQFVSVLDSLYLSYADVQVLVASSLQLLLRPLILHLFFASTSVSVSLVVVCANTCCDNAADVKVTAVTSARTATIAR